MKKAIFGALLSLLAALQTVSAGINNDDNRVFYTYGRNNDIQPVFVNNVDSIIFTRTDAEGFEHEDIVAQLICMPDTVIRIDIADVDSVSFVTPKTVYNKQAIVIDETPLWNYVRWADYSHISLRTDIARADVPHAGDRLVTVRTEGHFPSGFSAEVTDVTFSTDSILLTCKHIDPVLVLDRYYGVGAAGPNNHADAQKAPSRAPISNLPYFELTFGPDKYIDFDFTAKQTLSKYQDKYAAAGIEGNANGSLHYADHYTVKVAQVIEYGFSFSDVYVERLQFYNLNLSLAGSIFIEEYFDEDSPYKVKTEMPIPNAPFFLFYLEGSPTFGIRGDIGMDAEFRKEVLSLTHFSYSSNENLKTICTSDETVKSNYLDAKFMGDIEVKAGVKVEFGVKNAGYVDTKNFECGVKAYAGLEGGLKAEASMLFPASYTDHPISTEYYSDAVDESFIDLKFYLEGKLGVKGVMKFKDKDTGQEIGGEIGVERKAGFEHEFARWDAYPRFNMPVINAPKAGISPGRFSSLISGSLPIPVKVGYKVFDEGNNELISGYSDYTYRTPDDFNRYEVDIPDVSQLINRQCTVYPMFKFVDWEIIATPSAPVHLKVVPHTGNASGVTARKATLNGSIEGGEMLVSPNFAGIKISQSPQITSDARGGRTAIDCDGNISVTFSGLEKDTKYYYAAFVAANGKITWGETKSFTTPNVDYVDLGLSVYWASSNVGGKAETDNGLYFAWGETAAKGSYDWSNYFDSPYDAGGTWAGCNNITSDICGNSDYDAASKIMGQSWRMPTDKEMKELIDNCDWEWTTIDNVAGFKVKSRVNSNYIFLPASGNADGSEILNKGSYGAYWTGTVRPSGDHSTANNLYFVPSMKSTQWGNRYLGRTIRAVWPK